MERLDEIGGIAPQINGWLNAIMEGLNHTELPYGQSFTLYGDHYPDAYRQFPIDRLMVLSTNMRGQTLGAYDQDRSGIDMSVAQHPYKVFIYIDPPQIKRHGLIRMDDLIAHELKHAYDDWQIKTSHSPKAKNKLTGRPLDLTAGINAFKTADFLKVQNSGFAYYPYSNLFEFYYFLFKHEQSAYRENDLRGDSTFVFKLRNIFKFDFDYARQMAQNQWRWKELTQPNSKDGLDIPFLRRFKNGVDFVNYSEKYLKREATKALKKVMKTRALHGRVGTDRNLYE